MACVNIYDGPGDNDVYGYNSDSTKAQLSSGREDGGKRHGSAL